MLRVFPLLLALLWGCAHAPALPTLPAPTPSARKEEPPALPLSAMSVPLVVPLAELTQLLRDRIAIPSMPEYRLVSAPGDSPELEIRYFAEVLPPRISTQGMGVRVTVPVAYHGSFRVRVKTPFGWMWLTKGTDWGSPDKRGLIEVEIASQLAIDGGWQLSAHSSLENVQLTAPPISKLCTGGVFKVCVPAELVTDRVHRELDRQVRDRVQSELGQVDAQIAARVDLPRVASMVWQRLSEARPQLRGQPLSLAPEQMSLGEPVVQGDALAGELRVWARPTFGAGTHASPALPPPSQEPWQGQRVHLLTKLSFAEIGQHLTASAKQLASMTEELRIDGIELLGTAGEAGRYLFAIVLARGERQPPVYAEAQLVPDQQKLVLRELRWVRGSDVALKTSSISQDELAQGVQSAAADLSATLEQHLEVVRSALAESVAPWPARPLQGLRARVGSVHADTDGIFVSLEAP